jgi:hypothetical protein
MKFSSTQKILGSASAASVALAAIMGMASGNLFAQSANSAVVNPFSPAADHPYRHGAVPTREAHERMKAWTKANAASNASTAATGTQTLAYGGGVNGIGVTSGTPKVYLVVYGTQWGTSGTDANGNMTLSKDTYGAVPYLQNMFKHLGTGGELWSGVMTQYCDGPLVSSGATTCPSGAPHVGYPTGGAFAGIWYDNTAASPTSATGAQLAQEAIKAAAHFGNTTAASNRYVQYVILSPSGTTPDGFNTSSGNFCAWHDYTGDGYGVTSPYGDIAFTNMPYVRDAGTSCGMNSVNTTSGSLDGFSLVEGHEYAETITDQNPAGGWTNKTGSSYNGQENADECAWISSGQGASANVVMGTATFPMQSTWSNDTNRCDISHPIVTGGGSSVAITNPSNVTVAVGSTASFTVSASGGTSPYAYQWYRNGSAISGATSATYSFTAQSTDNGATFNAKVTDSATTPSTATSTTATLTVTTGGLMTERMANGGFESGSTSWTGTTADIGTFSGETAFAGTKYAWLDGYGSAHTESIAQTVTIPSSSTQATLSFYLHIDTAETTTTSAYDKLVVTLKNTSGTVLKTLATYSNLNKATGYQQHSFDVSAYAGQTVQVVFTGTEDSSLQTSFVLDNVSLMSN